MLCWRAMEANGRDQVTTWKPTRTIKLKLEPAIIFVIRDLGTWGYQWEQDCKNILLSFNEWGGNDTHERGTEFRQAAALMHELGHDFGLFHGGFEAERDVDNKPNYLSHSKVVCFLSQIVSMIYHQKLIAD
jgi:hypothetical protein